MKNIYKKYKVLILTLASLFAFGAGVSVLNNNLNLGGGINTINTLPQRIETLDEGSSLTARTSSFNFVGAGVTATNSGNAVTVTIGGGSTTLADVSAASTDSTKSTYTATSSVPVLFSMGSEEFRIGNSATNYMSAAVASTAVTTFDLTASSGTPYFVFNKAVGIGTIVTGSTQLDVNGETKIRGLLYYGSGLHAYLTASSTRSSQYVFNGSSYIERISILANGDVGIGTVTPSAKLHILSTTEQFRSGYDTSNYLSLTTGTTGNTTIQATGSSGKIYFNGSSQATATINEDGEFVMSRGDTSLNSNFFAGTGAGANITSAVANVGIGAYALGGANAGTSVGIGYYALAVATGQQNFGLGYQAGLSLTTGSNNVFLGASSGYLATTSQGLIAIGPLSAANASGSNTSNYGIYIGEKAGQTLTGTSGIGIGYLAQAGAFSLALGRETNASTTSIAMGWGATTTTTKQFVIGRQGYAPIEELYGGSGVTATSKQNSFRINATGGSGTDIGGTDLSLAGGRGTGSGIGGSIFFQTTAAGASATTLRTLFTAMTLKGGTGYLGLGTTSPNTKLHLTGGLSLTPTTVNAATYDLLVTDVILHVTYTTTGAVTSLTLPTAQTTSGRYITIKDAGGNATTNTITIDTEGSETIDGASTFIINGNYDWVSLYSDGSNWFVVG